MALRTRRTVRLPSSLQGVPKADQGIKDYAANYNTMTDAPAQDYMKRANAVDEQLLALRMK